MTFCDPLRCLILSPLSSYFLLESSASCRSILVTTSFLIALAKFLAKTPAFLASNLFTLDIVFHLSNPISIFGKEHIDGSIDLLKFIRDYRYESDTQTQNTKICFVMLTLNLSWNVRIKIRVSWWVFPYHCGDGTVESFLYWFSRRLDIFIWFRWV